MLEQLKKAEELVKKFNSLPEEQRYIYDKNNGDVIIVKKIDAIRLDSDSSNLYWFKGHIATNENRWWSSWFRDIDNITTKEEALKQAKKSTIKLEERIRKTKAERNALESVLEDLEEELRKLKGRNKC